MLEVKGKYNTAKIFTDTVDSSCIGQITSLCNLEIYKNEKIRMMPDCHAGKGCTVGTTMTISDAITPNLVGVDIGCGMLAVKLKEKRIDLPAFDSVIRKYIPSGSAVHKVPVKYNFMVQDLRCLRKARFREELSYCSLGTLGGGNHFIELDRDEDGNIWLIIHTGSRHLGIEVCEYYQKAAYTELKFLANSGNYETHSLAFVAELKRQGRHSDINKELQKFRKNYREVEPSVPFELAYCTGQLLSDYIYDMGIVQGHAKINRETIAQIILKNAKLHEVDSFHTVHNYIDRWDMILRKGAVSAKQGERLLIPINMAEGSLICVGKGNDDWNHSAPHGAGRLYSRRDVKDLFSLSDYKKVMKDSKVFTTSVSQGTLDECPMAYKPMESIVENIKDTAEIVNRLTPIYNFKASKSED